MILTDAGPLVALINTGEPDHARCRQTTERLAGPLLTTWPVFTEAMYLLGDLSGWNAQELLWRLLAREQLLIADIGRRGLERMATLMAKYRDLPMDLADASLVAVAEERGFARIFTLDRHFSVYRTARGKTLTILP